MYFYNILAIILGILALYLSAMYIFKPKGYKQILENKHFKRKESIYIVLNIIISLICGLSLLLSGFLHFIPYIKFDYKDQIFLAIYITTIVIYLILSHVIERTFVEKPIKVTKAK